MTENKLYRTPFSPSYWRTAADEFCSSRMMIMAALMIAMARALSLIPSIPIAHTKFSFGFLARALCGLIGGPVTGIFYGIAEDVVGLLIEGGAGGPPYLGYTISTVMGMLVYSFCFYRTRITVWRLFLANLLVNVLVNAALGSLWKLDISGGVYWAWFWPSLGKNLVTIIPKTLLMLFLYQPLLPILQRMGVIPKQIEGKVIPWF